MDKNGELHIALYSHEQAIKRIMKSKRIRTLEDEQDLEHTLTEARQATINAILALLERD